MSADAITPIDGRYFYLTKGLSSIFSEKAFVRYRLGVEISYFKFLSSVISDLDDYTDLSVLIPDDFYEQFKDLERKTNHDVKAIEYLAQKVLIDAGIRVEDVSFIHFGLTSQDINDPALALSIRDGLSLLIDNLSSFMNSFVLIPDVWWAVPMLSYTHGQPASPTVMGKEMMVYHSRLERQVCSLNEIVIQTKFGGAVGNLNAHIVAYPGIDWVFYLSSFIHSLSLGRNEYTTQVDHYDSISEVLDCIKRINVILLDFVVDVWLYIHKGYFKLRVNKGETGSSTMPHKVNPIDFENAEGNLKMANSILGTISMELPRSRMQRDLSGSTIGRNIGSAFAYTIIAIQKVIIGFSKLDLDTSRMSVDLEKNVSVITEGIQTILRKYRYPNAYEKLKDFSRGKELDILLIKEFIGTLEVNDSIKDELLLLCDNFPGSYLGLFKTT